MSGPRLVSWPFGLGFALLTAPRVYSQRAVDDHLRRSLVVVDDADNGSGDDADDAGDKAEKDSSRVWAARVCGYLTTPNPEMLKLKP